MAKFEDVIDGTGRRRFIAGGLGLAIGTATLPATTDLAEAHFPTTLDIDVEPGTERNHVLAESGGYVLVAVLGTDEFDPTSEVVRYRFGTAAAVNAGNGARPAFGGTVTDVDNDGTDDLLLHFPVSATGFADCEESNRTAKLVWERNEAGEHGYSGTDNVTVGRVVPKRETVHGGEDNTDDGNSADDATSDDSTSNESGHGHSDGESYESERNHSKKEAAHDEDDC